MKNSDQEVRSATGEDVKPALRALTAADPPERWRALGFAIPRDELVLGGIRMALGGSGEGITAWSISGLTVADESRPSIDGLATVRVGSAEAPTPLHPNGATAIDQVVVATPDFDRTAAALDAVGMPLRRIRDAGGFRQGFRRLGPAILELVEADRMPAGDARFWGLVVIVSDLDRLAERLGPERLGSPKPAVQPGRRIATLKATAGLSPHVAFMTP